jgi:hypothetical protein
MRKLCVKHNREVKFMFKDKNRKVYYCELCFALIEEKDVYEKL